MHQVLKLSSARVNSDRKKRIKSKTTGFYSSKSSMEGSTGVLEWTKKHKAEFTTTSIAVPRSFNLLETIPIRAFLGEHPVQRTAIYVQDGKSDEVRVAVFPSKKSGCRKRDREGQHPFPGCPCRRGCRGRAETGGTLSGPTKGQNPGASSPRKRHLTYHSQQQQ